MSCESTVWLKVLKQYKVNTGQLPADICVAKPSTQPKKKAKKEKSVPLLEIATLAPARPKTDTSAVENSTWKGGFRTNPQPVNPPIPIVVPKAVVLQPVISCDTEVASNANRSLHGQIQPLPAGSSTFTRLVSRAAAFQPPTTNLPVAEPKRVGRGYRAFVIPKKK